MKEKVLMSVKKAVLASACVASAVALPQIFHAIGAFAGTAFLPMHIPVILAGFLLGPLAGFAVGALSPVLSFAISGMPALTILPFIVIELATYGLIGGYIKDTKIHNVLKLLVVQIGGRTVKAAAIIGGFYLFGTKVPVSVAYTSIADGIPGIVLQLVLIPLILYGFKKK